MHFSKSFARGGVWFLFVFSIWLNAFGSPDLEADASAKIVDLTAYRAKRACAQMLRSTSRDPMGPAEILQYKHPVPPLVPWNSFKAELRALEPDTHYFYHGSFSNKAPFSKHDPGVWMSQSYVPHGDYLYILKARSKPTERPESAAQASYNIHQLRARYELIAYTRISVPALIKILALAIHHTRMMESNLANLPYYSQQMPYDTLLRADSLKQAAVEFVDLWKAANVHEEDIKWFLKDMILREDHRSHSPERTNKIKKAIQEKLESVYKNSPY